MTIIKANKKFFKWITTIIKYVKIFLFRKDYLIIQILIIKNCKAKIFIQVMTYTRLAMNFFKDSF